MLVPLVLLDLLEMQEILALLGPQVLRVQQDPLEMQEIQALQVPQVLLGVADRLDLLGLVVV
jgi:hypothetical protein